MLQSLSNTFRLFIDLGSELGSGKLPARVQLSSEDSHHLKNVLKKKTGDNITIIDSSSKRKFTASLIHNENGDCAAEISSEILEENLRSFVRCLLVPLLKNDNNDLILEKAVELGVAEIIFWQAARSIAKIDSEKDQEKKLTKFNKQAKSAHQQSGNPNSIKISFHKKLKDALEELNSFRNENDLSLCCALRSDSMELRTFDKPPQADIHLIIGPEGDFTPEELSLIESYKFKFLDLGPNILRAETAAICAVSSVNAIFGFYKA